MTLADEQTTVECRPASAISPRGMLRLLPASVVFGVIGLAGVLKAADAYAFARTVAQWTILPGPLIGLVAVAVPSLEIGLAVSWFVGLFRRWILVASILMLLGFSGFLSWQFFEYGPVDCGCFGARADRAARTEDLYGIVGRNLVMCLVLLISLAAGPRSAPGLQPDRGRHAR